MLNTIYNCADVGVNTCKGEGWGLVNFEHAACRVAQVVPGHTSCKEIFEGYGRLIKCPHIDTETNYGRDHHPRSFTIFMAGAGVKPGFTYGETDDLGYNIVKDPVHVHDLQATILHLFGINHEKMIYKYQGRIF